MIKLNKDILLIDLDGTFVSINTFHKWIKFLFIQELKKMHIISLLKILKIIILRLTKTFTHAQMKFAILQLSEKVIRSPEIVNFVNSLDKYVSTDILKKLKDDTSISILATAAPLIYAKQIKEKYHFDYVLATEYTDEKNWAENIKEIKRTSYHKLLEKQDITPKNVVLYTDHHDDLPLMQVSNLIYLVNASEKTINLISDKNILVKCINL